jgi:3'-5' exoribonuclease
VKLCEQYSAVDRDLLLAGALVQGMFLGKEPAHEGKQEGFDEGRLVGAGVLAAQKLREKASRLEGFPPLLEQHLTHLAISHPNGGRPAMTLEAVVLGAAWGMELQVGSFLETLARDSHSRWADGMKTFGRWLWKEAAPTSRGRAPTEGRKPRRERGERGEHKAGEHKAGEHKGEPRAEKAERPARPASEAAGREHKPRGEAKPHSLPKEMTFKPFAVLAKDPGSPEGGGEG